MSLAPGRAAQAPRGYRGPPEARIGKTHTEEVKNLMSLSRRKENNSFYGKTHSQETKALLSAYQLSRTSDPNPGFLIDLYSSDNKLLASFKSIREAARHFKADTRTISRYLGSNKLFRGEYYLRNKAPGAGPLPVLGVPGPRPRGYLISYNLITGY